MEQERDFEMSDGEMMDTDDETEKVVEQDPDPKSTIFYKADKNGLMLKELDKIDAVKLEERAKRFGINLSGSRLVTQKQIDELYKNFGIESGNERHFRFDALHLNGVHGLTTKDIFAYLQDYKPVSLEWVDENSCNVICQDHISVALALLVHSREIISEEIKDMISKRSSYHWREGMPHPLVDMIFMRFATNSDKKNPKKIPEQKLKSRIFERMDVNGQTKNPWGDLCQSWGVYDHQEIFQRRLINNKEESFETNSDEERPYKPIKIKNEKLAKRLGKRNHIPSDEIDSDSDSEWKSKSKTPRMRMHADDEESKIKKISQLENNDEDDDDDDEREFAPLSIEVLNKKSIFRPRESKVLSEKFKRAPQQITASIQSRLGVKVATDADLSSEDSLSDSDHNVMSRVQKVKKGQSNSVWSRLEVKASNSTEHNDLRQMLKTKKNKSNESTSLKSNDLRKRLGKPKTNLRIEIDNS